MSLLLLLLLSAEAAWARLAPPPPPAPRVANAPLAAAVSAVLGGCWCVSLWTDGSALASSLLPEAAPMPVALPGDVCGRCRMFLAADVKAVCLGEGASGRTLVMAPGPFVKTPQAPPGTLFFDLRNGNLFKQTARSSRLRRVRNWRQLWSLQTGVQLLRAATFTLVPFSYIDDGVRDGIEMNMFLELSRKLKFRWSLVEPPRENRYGEWLPNETWSGGLAGMLITGEADVAFCTLYLVLNKVQHLDMSTPWSQVCITFLVPRPETLKGWKGLVLPLQTSTWAVLLTTALAIGFIFHTMPGPEGFIQMLGILLLASFPTDDRKRGTVRPIIIAWSYFCMLMTTMYCSKLISHLTKHYTTQSLDTVKDLTTYGMFWGMDYEVPANDIFNPNDPWAVMFMKKFIKEKDKKDRAKRLANKNYVILGTQLNGKYFIEGPEISHENILKLQGMKKCLNKFFIAFAFPKNSPLTQPFSRIIQRMVETGLTHYWEQTVVMRRMDAALALLSNLHIDVHEAGPSVLKTEDLFAVFMIFLFGQAIALLSFISELAYAKTRIETNY